MYAARSGARPAPRARARGRARHRHRPRALLESRRADRVRLAPDHDHFCNDGYVETWPEFARMYELRIGRDAIALGERVAQRKALLEARIVESAATLIHGDLRGDNLLLDPTNGDIVLLDWQLSSRSLGAIDPARLLGGSEPQAERRGHQLEIFSAWHQALIAGGLRNYSADAGLDDFRLAALYCLFIPVKMFAMVSPQPSGRVGRLVDCQAERFFAAALELDAGRMLP
ncbi:MAG: phosphotransferase [bacterium]